MASDPSKLSVPSLTDDADDEGEHTRVAPVSARPEAAVGGDLHAYFIVLTGPHAGEMHRIDGPEVVLGRGTTAGLRFDDDRISRQHAIVKTNKRGVHIEDLDSVNGTFVNGEQVKERELQNGDKVRIGSTVVLKFTYQDKLEVSFQEQLYDAALRDGLTKAFNRRHFLEQLQSELAFAQRHKTPLALIMLDIDFFKKVNDTYGHLAGDAVLVRFAKIIGGTLRAEDVLARYGGEEFGVICRGTALDQAVVLAERLRLLVEQTDFTFGGQKIPVTSSMGVAAFPEHPADTPAALIAAADEALYAAKHGGRNRVEAKRGPDVIPTLEIPAVEGIPPSSTD